MPQRKTKTRYRRIECHYLIKNKSKHTDESQERNISIITGRQVTTEDIREAVMLDTLVYDDIYHVDTTQCEEWFDVNPDIYVMAKDNHTGKVIAYVNISPASR